MENNNINIETIMADIKRKIKEENLTADMLSFEDIPCNKPTEIKEDPIKKVTETSLYYLNTHYYIQPHRELRGNLFKVFIKKVLRKMIKFYIDPVVFEQNEFNSNTVRVLNELVHNADSFDINELFKKIDTVFLVNKQFAIRLDKLERENAQLKKELEKRG